MLVSDLLNAILEEINAVAAGQTPAPEDYTISQTYLNNLIGSWNAAIQKSLLADVTMFQVKLANYAPNVYSFSPSSLVFIPVPVTVNLGDPISLPYGWPRALTFNTALDLCSPYGKPATEDLVNLAAQSKAEIITPNQAPAPTT